MKVEIIKMHKKYLKLFPIGSETTLVINLKDNESITRSSVDNKWYNVFDMCKCFSNHCSFSDLFKKI